MKVLVMGRKSYPCGHGNSKRTAVVGLYPRHCKVCNRQWIVEVTPANIGARIGCDVLKSVWITMDEFAERMRGVADAALAAKALMHANTDEAASDQTDSADEWASPSRIRAHVQRGSDDVGHP